MNEYEKMTSEEIIKKARKRRLKEDFLFLGKLLRLIIYIAAELMCLWNAVLKHDSYYAAMLCFFTIITCWELRHE